MFHDTVYGPLVSASPRAASIPGRTGRWRCRLAVPMRSAEHRTVPDTDARGRRRHRCSRSAVWYLDDVRHRDRHRGGYSLVPDGVRGPCESLIRPVQDASRGPRHLIGGRRIEGSPAGRRSTGTARWPRRSHRRLSPPPSRSTPPWHREDRSRHRQRQDHRVDGHRDRGESALVARSVPTARTMMACVPAVAVVESQVASFQVPLVSVRQSRRRRRRLHALHAHVVAGVAARAIEPAHSGTGRWRHDGAIGLVVSPAPSTSRSHVAGVPGADDVVLGAAHRTRTRTDSSRRPAAARQRR